MNVQEYADQISVPENFLRDYCGISDFKTSNQQHALAIPYFNKENEVVRTRLRFGTREEKTMRWQKQDEGKPMIPYGLLWFNQHHQEAYLAEGESDTISLFYKSFNVLGVPGVSTFKNEWITNYLMNIEALYLVFDNDEAGLKCTERVIEALRNARFKGIVKVIELRTIA